MKAPDQTPAAVVLCGGLGTRLRSAVSDRPKVLAEVAGRALLDHLIQRLQESGVSRVILSAAYLAEQIVAYAENARTRGTLEVIVEEGQLGTAGALAFAARSAELTTPFLAMNGDTLATVDVGDLIREHSANPDAPATISVVPSADPARYGSVVFDETNRVTAFREKVAPPPKSQSATTWINAGVYMISPGALSTVVPGVPVSLERELFPAWIGRMRVLPDPRATILDIGTPEDYARAENWLRQQGWISRP